MCGYCEIYYVKVICMNFSRQMHRGEDFADTVSGNLAGVNSSPAAPSGKPEGNAGWNGELGSSIFHGALIVLAGFLMSASVSRATPVTYTYTGKHVPVPQKLRHMHRRSAGHDIRPRLRLFHARQSSGRQLSRTGYSDRLGDVRRIQYVVASERNSDADRKFRFRRGVCCNRCAWEYSLLANVRRYAGGYFQRCVPLSRRDGHLHCNTNSVQLS